MWQGNKCHVTARGREVQSVVMRNTQPGSFLLMANRNKVREAESVLGLTLGSNTVPRMLNHIIIYL